MQVGGGGGNRTPRRRATFVVNSMKGKALGSNSLSP
jgi:hypothetical protein